MERGKIGGKGRGESVGKGVTRTCRGGFPRIAGVTKFW